MFDVWGGDKNGIDSYSGGDPFQFSLAEPDPLLERGSGSARLISVGVAIIPHAVSRGTLRKFWPASGD